MLSAAPAAPAAPPSPGLGDGEIFGHLGAGGAALVVTVVLVLGVKATGKGKALSWNLTLFLGALAATLYAGAGGIWSTPADLLASLLTAFGVGGGTGPLGNVGMGAVACCIAAILYWRKLTLKQVAVLGFVAAYVAGRAGGIWGVAASIVASTAKFLGV
ncbi:hypothetical protein [Streptomyces sp. Z26]|uniref:hypothetical protein n=1 Tax=Streptomyces sp. Z26 TaxID=2500177 RepID=UPI000EF15D9D|nr:hypothetical protein [Streptomyces sp. Z26]RLL68150.1 hypothetical protein D7M15_16345 [Streptomyces sp. Z26]